MADGYENHLRNPKTGRKIISNFITATVIGSKASQTEVLAKMLIQSDLGQAKKLLANTSTTGLVVDDKGKVIRLANFNDYEINKG